MLKQVTMIFNSGKEIQFVVNEITITKNGFGEFIGLNWNCDGLAESPLRINIGNIDAILVKDIKEVKDYA